MSSGGILLLTAILGLIAFTIATKRPRPRSGDPSGTSDNAHHAKNDDDNGHDGDGGGGGDGGAD